MCYIGVTKSPNRRWKEHQRSSYCVGNYIRKNNLTYKENFHIIYQGNKKDCYDLENKYRPVNYMGLNEASGGNGGYTSYSKERNLKISLAMKEIRKNKKWGPKELRNMSLYNNPRAKEWEIISPEGKVFNIKGTLSLFCKENLLLETCLRYYKNGQVPKTNLKGYGGYRAKNTTSDFLRNNTTGWTLKEVPGGV